MTDTAIRVQDLSKRYRIVTNEVDERGFRYKTLRESIASASSRLFRRLGGSSSHAADTPFWALEGVSFEVNRGEIVGVIGRNGAGKSTLLKLLSRITPPTRGRAEIHGRVGSLLEVGTGFHPELSGRDNVFMNGAILGMKRVDIQRHFDAIIAFAQVETFVDTPVKHYSTGMYLRLAFAVAAHLDTEILLVDEVLAVGDQRFQEKCLGKMQDVASSGRTILFVSHSMASIERLCSRAIALENGRLVADSAPAAVIARYIGGDIPTIYIDTPNDSQPVITKASLGVRENTLLLSVEFRSPFPLVPPILGFVVYNSVGVPVFGTNNRTEVLASPPQPSISGRFEISISAENFRPDRYLVSLWLGDPHVDFCIREQVLAIDLNTSVGGGLPISIHGNAYLPTQWTFTAFEER